MIETSRLLRLIWLKRVRLHSQFLLVQRAQTNKVVDAHKSEKKVNKKTTFILSFPLFAPFSPGLSPLSKVHARQLGAKSFWAFCLFNAEGVSETRRQETSNLKLIKHVSDISFLKLAVAIVELKVKFNYHCEWGNRVIPQLHCDQTIRLCSKR